MGLLPSQKYDFIFYEFCEWLIFNEEMLESFKKEHYKFVVDNFLRYKDGGGQIDPKHILEQGIYDNIFEREVIK